MFDFGNFFTIFSIGRWLRNQAQGWLPAWLGFDRCHGKLDELWDLWLLSQIHWHEVQMLWVRMPKMVSSNLCISQWDLFQPGKEFQKTEGQPLLSVIFFKNLDNINRLRIGTSSTKCILEGSFVTTKRPLTWPKKSSTTCIWKNLGNWTRAVPEKFTSKQAGTLYSRNPKFSPFPQRRLPHPYLITSCRQSNVTLHKTTWP